MNILGWKNVLFRHITNKFQQIKTANMERIRNFEKMTAVRTVYKTSFKTLYGCIA